MLAGRFARAGRCTRAIACRDERCATWHGCAAAPSNFTTAQGSTSTAHLGCRASRSSSASFARVVKSPGTRSRAVSGDNWPLLVSPATCSTCTVLVSSVLFADFAPTCGHTLRLRLRTRICVRFAYRFTSFELAMVS
eukprot:6206316-Pleurochrysis_carterae.AAC.1